MVELSINFRFVFKKQMNLFDPSGPFEEEGGGEKRPLSLSSSQLPYNECMRKGKKEPHFHFDWCWFDVSLVHSRGLHTQQEQLFFFKSGSKKRRGCVRLSVFFSTMATSLFFSLFLKSKKELLFPLSLSFFYPSAMMNSCVCQKKGKEEESKKP